MDASSYKKTVARYANDAKGLQKVKGLQNNSVYRHENLRVFIESTKDIAANTEILVEYGKEYWDVIRYNARLTAEENKKKNKKKSTRKK